MMITATIFRNADGDEVNTVGRSDAAASSIVLPVLRGIDVPHERPACPSLREQPCREYVELANSTE